MNIYLTFALFEFLEKLVSFVERPNESVPLKTLFYDGQASNTEDLDESFF